ncbi:LPXTG cell wall anchor domain-containing protein [Gemella cuniculi]|uniref:LPXTG cell wall anchor domain-containing protein n=1 Tax=Gemella cuniculi TaxID=150240 RepID=UPI0003FBC954|nr:LPXTG cell wall anchor domain-containing protein [Gemella cuniculi]
MNKKIKFFITFLFTLLLCTVAIYEKNIVKAGERTFSPMVLENGEPVEEPISFKLISNDGSNHVIQATNEEGYIDFKKVKEEVSYTVSLEKNNTYSMNSFSFTIKDGIAYRDDNNDMLLSLDVSKITSAETEKSDNSTTDEADNSNKINEKRTTLFLAVLDRKDEVTDNLKFEFKSNDETITSDNDEGQVGAKLKQNTSYTVKLLDNSKYNMDSFSFTIKDGTPYRDDNGELVVSLDLKKKNTSSTIQPNNPTNKEDSNSEDCGCDETNQQKVKIKKMKLVDSKNPEGETIKDKLTFVFFNVSKQKPAGEFTSEDGKLPEIELIADDEYEVYLKENDNYGMKHRRIYAFMNHYPIDMDDPYERYIDSFELIKKDKDYVEPQRESVEATMQVAYKGKVLKDELTFEFVSNNETIRATSKNGIVKVNLREGVDYMVGLVNSDKYDIETFPIVIKNKQVGKFPYDHRTCYLVEYLNVVDKGTISTTNPHYTIATKDEKVRISGMNFADLKLDVQKIDSSTIPALNGKKADVYDINFINIYRKEVVKLKGDFTVTLPKERGKKVIAIYYINNLGQLEKRDPIDGEFNSVITFKTDHFSRYALVYEEDNQPNAEEPKGNMPKVDQPNAEEPKGDMPKVDQPKDEKPKGDMPKVDQPNAEEPKGDMPKVDQPKTENPKGDIPKVDQPKDEKPKGNMPKVDQPKTENPKGNMPKVDELKAEAPKKAEKPNTNAHSTNTKATKLPNTGNSAANTTFAGILVLLSTLASRKVKR